MITKNASNVTQCCQQCFIILSEKKQSEENLEGVLDSVTRNSMHVYTLL